MRKNQLHISIWLLTAFAMLTGCESPQVMDEPATGDSKVKLELTIQANSYQLPLNPLTRANDDEVISTMWLLIFQGNDATATFAEAVEVEKEDGKSYVELAEQTSSCQLLALANPQSQFYANGIAYDFTKANLETILANKTLDQASKLLLSIPLNNPQTTLPLDNDIIPMSGQTSMSQINFNTPIPPFSMKRVVAKVIVRNTDYAFKFLGITAIFNTPKQTQLHNIDGSLTYNTGSGKLVDYKTDANYSSDFLAAVDMGGGIQSTEDNPINVFESNTEDNDTYLLIRGMWQGEIMYYKIGFVDSSKNQLNLERNTVYAFAITQINARGFATVRDALLGKPSNTDLDFVITVQDNWSYEISGNNEYYVGVSNSHFELYAPGGSTQYTAFTLVTDCSNPFVDRKHIRSLTTGLAVVSPTSDSYGAVIPLITTPLEVKITVTSAFTEGQLEIHLGSIKKTVTVRRRNRVSAGTTISSNFSMNTAAYYTSAYVENYPMTDGTKYMNNSVSTSIPSTSNWLQLAPGGQTIRNDPHHVYSDTGLIDLYVGSTTSGNTGTVYVSTGKTEMQRSKVMITM